MARDHARMYCSIWGDRDWRALPMTAQWLYELALTQLDLNYAGVVAYRPVAWAEFSSDATPTQVRKASKTLEAHGFVVIDTDTTEMLVRTFIKHDRVLRQPNVAINMARAARQIVSPKIRRAFDEVLVRLRDDDSPTDPMKGWAEPEVASLLLEARVSLDQ